MSLRDELVENERAALVIGADKRVKMSLQYPSAVGMNFHEILRCIDALQLAAARKRPPPRKMPVPEAPGARGAVGQGARGGTGCELPP